MIIGGCNDKESRIKRDVAKMMSQQIRIPINDMQCRFNASHTTRLIKWHPILRTHQSCVPMVG